MVCVDSGGSSAWERRCSSVGVWSSVGGVRERGRGLKGF
jgi:hypothetical protein